MTCRDLTNWAPRRRFLRLTAAICTLTLVLSLFGCNGAPDSHDEGDSQASQDAQNSQSDETTLRADIEAMDFDCSNRDKDTAFDEAAATTLDLAAGSVNGTGAAFDAESATFTVTQAGTYVVTGQRDQGQVVVQADKESDKVQLVLAGATLTNQNGPALLVESADKVFVTLADDTHNFLTAGTAQQADVSAQAQDGNEQNTETNDQASDENDWAAVLSREDLTFNGTGALTVRSHQGHGLYSKDDLVICGGTFDIQALGDGLRGKDCIKVADGALTVVAAGDALKSTNSQDAARGFITVEGGTLDLKAADDAVDAQHYFRVMGGNMKIEAQDDAFHSESDGRVAGGTIVLTAGDDAFHAEYELVIDEGAVEVQDCNEGYEAQRVVVNGGKSTIVAQDDAVNASAAGQSSTAGEGTPDGFDGQEPNQDVRGFDGKGPDENGSKGAAPTDGTTPPEPPQNQEPGNDMRAPDNDQEHMQKREPFDAQGQSPDGQGEPPALPQDSAPGAQDSIQGEGMGNGRKMPTAANASQDCLIQINGGELTVYAQGDGLDSNGSIEVNGGTVLVSGPSSAKDGAIDYEFDATVNGGVVLAVGPAGMAEGFTGGSQASVLAQVTGQGGDTVVLADQEGNEIVSFTPKSAFQTAVVSAPGLPAGSTAQLTVGDRTTSVVLE